jgi:N-acetylneuraminate lyase
MKQFTGIFPAIITPFNREGKIHERSLEILIKQGIERGVSGFFVCGGTGEGLMMSADERKYITEIAVESAGGRAAIISNIGSFSTDAGIELAKHAEAAGAAAIASVPPFYFKFAFDEYVEYYNDVSSSVGIPMLVYNIPAQSGISFSFEEFCKLYDNEKLIGAKLTIMDVYLIQRLAERYPNHSFFSGFDEAFLSAKAVGIKAAIGSTIALMPEKYLKVEDCYCKGENEEASKTQAEINYVVTELLKVGLIRGTKELFTLQGIPCGDCRKPFRPLSAEEKEIVKALLPLINPS